MFAGQRLAWTRSESFWVRLSNREVFFMDEKKCVVLSSRRASKFTSWSQLYVSDATKHCWEMMLATPCFERPEASVEGSPCHVLVGGVGQWLRASPSVGLCRRASDAELRLVILGHTALSSANQNSELAPRMTVRLIFGLFRKSAFCLLSTVCFFGRDSFLPPSLPSFFLFSFRFVLVLHSRTFLFICSDLFVHCALLRSSRLLPSALLFSCFLWPLLVFIGLLCLLWSLVWFLESSSRPCVYVLDER